MTTTERKSWAEFNRYKNHTNFYGCVNAEGEWFDSSENFDTAIHWCCYCAGEMDLSVQEEQDWMATEGLERGYSIVHSTLLRRMYEAGLIK
jgi:peptide methionine sulfoxide reductase MsrB